MIDNEGDFRPNRDRREGGDRPRGGDRSGGPRGRSEGQGRDGDRWGPGQGRSGDGRGRDGDRRSGDRDDRARDGRFGRTGPGARSGRGGRSDRGDRSGGDRARFSGGRREDRPVREEREERFIPPGLEVRDNEPDLPGELDLRELPRGVRAELRSLTAELADKVGGHVLMAGLLVDEDPELAYRHAMVARRMAARLPVVRAATAEAAYAAGEFAAALSEFRALRRMTGDNELFPVMADCERAIGRPEAALEIAREVAGVDLPRSVAVEMRIVEAGARADMGQRNEALRLLKAGIQQSNARGYAASARARVRYAYADLLLAGGDEKAALQWFAAAAKLDTEGTTDAEDRIAELEGLVIDFDETDETDEIGDPGSEKGAHDRAEPEEAAAEGDATRDGDDA